ncbi:MAG: hypothetical protein ABWZ88_07780 [Variovorax sp.]
MTTHTARGARRQLLASLLLAPALAAAQEMPPLKPCRDHPQIRGACFKVHGRARGYMTMPTVRIQPSGTQRLLGVSEGRFRLDGYANFPPELADAVKLGSELSGDFTICPFEPQRPGVMQLVCVQSVSNPLATGP